MIRGMRHSGVEALGDVPWGTHFCQFYETPQELLDVSLPFFQRGLRDNESCMWITSEPVGAVAARHALAGAVPDLEERIHRGQIEFLDSRQWYAPRGQFEPERVLEGWAEKERTALAQGYAGLRVAANESWLGESTWRAFADYEAAADRMIGSLRLLVACAYPIQQCSGADILDVLRHHPLALVNNDGCWEVLQSPQRRKMEESLRESEERVEFALEVIDAGAWDLDLTDHTAHRSLRHDQIFGYESLLSEWTYEMFLEHVLPEDREVVDQQFRHAVATGGDWSFECRIRRRDGQIRWIWAAGRHRAGAEGEPTHMGGIIQDITDRKHSEQEKLDLERRLFDAQRLESLGMLAGGIAHDFNNILAGIRMFTEALQAGSGNSTVAHEHLKQIKKATQQGADLTRQILTYAGKAAVDPKPLDLSRTVDGMKKMLEVVSKKASLRFDLASDLPTAMADPGQISQVVLNLVVNAAEALGTGGGAISVSTSTFRVDRGHPIRGVSGEELRPGRFVCLDVADTGCGMDHATQERIFQPFFSTKAAGRGLGLATVHGIIRSHQGALLVASESGKGSSFRVLLPAIDAASPLPAPRESAKPVLRRGSGTVLVVDDEEMVRQGTRALFESTGFRVLLAGDGEEALDLFRHHREEIVCVVLDLAMPKGGGEEAFRQFRRIDPHLRIVVTSGCADEAMIQRFAGEAVFDFVRKPESIDKVIAKLQKALAELD